MNWIGVPYQGEKFCREFARQVLAEQGIQMPCVDDPNQAPNWERVERPMPYDVVVFKRAGRADHVGVCIGRGDFLHVEERRSSCIERLSSPKWERRIEGYYRFTGVRQ